MERGGRCGGSLAYGASPFGEAARSGASRNGPSVTFAHVEPSKEAHDSGVPKRSADAGGVSQASRSPGPRAHRGADHAGHH